MFSPFSWLFRDQLEGFAAALRNFSRPPRNPYLSWYTIYSSFIPPFSSVFKGGGGRGLENIDLYYYLVSWSCWRDQSARLYIHKESEGHYKDISNKSSIEQLTCHCHVHSSGTKCFVKLLVLLAFFHFPSVNPFLEIIGKLPTVIIVAQGSWASIADSAGIKVGVQSQLSKLLTWSLIGSRLTLAPITH